MVAPCMNLQRKPPRLLARLLPSSIRAQLESPPSRDNSPAEFRYVLARGCGRNGGIMPPHATRLRDESNPSPLSSRPLCPAPPVSTPTSLPLPCSTLARLSSAPTCGTLPVMRHLKHEVDHDLAPVTTPAAADLPRLVMHVPRSVPSLAGVTPRAPHRMSRAPARA